MLYPASKSRVQERPRQVQPIASSASDRAIGSPVIVQPPLLSIRPIRWPRAEPVPHAASIALRLLLLETLLPRSDSPRRGLDFEQAPTETRSPARSAVHLASD